MNHVFQATHGIEQPVEFTTADEAAKFVEARTSGTVVEFLLEPNAPGCLPKHVHRSLAMWCYQAGAWHRHAIFDGTGGALGVERPGSDAIEKARRFVVQVHVTAHGQDWWNELSRHASRGAADRAMAKSQRHLPDAELRIHDERATTTGGQA